MFDIGWSELLVIGVVAIIVVGPKDLPRLMRSFGTYTGRLRRMAADFQRQFEEAVKESEIDEVRKAMQDFRADAPRMDLRAHIDSPLMLPKQAPALDAPPIAQASAATPAEPEAKPKPKPKAKKPRAKAVPATVPAEAAPAKAPAEAAPAKAPAKAAPAKAKAAAPKPRQARKAPERKP